MAKQQYFLVAFGRPEHDAAEGWKGGEKKGSRHTVMFKYKFVFTTILTSRNEIRKMK